MKRKLEYVTSLVVIGDCMKIAVNDFLLVRYDVMVRRSFSVVLWFLTGTALTPYAKLGTFFKAAAVILGG